jgi:hypothetical protein
MFGLTLNKMIVLANLPAPQSGQLNALGFAQVQYFALMSQSRFIARRAKPH